MIPRIHSPEHQPTWQALLQASVKSVDELLRRLEIDPATLNIRPLANDFPLRVPPGFVDRMVRGDSSDPLLHQVLPVMEESLETAGYGCDPLDEQASMVTPGLLHKYHGRALLTLTGACAINCRYCFRRHFPYSEANPVSDNRARALEYLRQHPDITEIILSGGDPLMLPDARLQPLAMQLAEIPQLQTLRIHTRLPIVLPERIDAALLSWVRDVPLKIVMVMHCNHPNEIDATVQQAMQQLARAGVTLLNQSVLLRGINDDAATLIRLSKALFRTGILPYYLHQLDRVQGSAHFEVSDTRARRLAREISAALPGYLVPRLVREMQGRPGKTPLEPAGH
jgi:EF-P beta-lysylation protein EpmB